MEEQPLDIFGQNSRLFRLYTQLCFCFSLPDDSAATQSAAVFRLEDGIQRLAEHFPWTSGQVLFSKERGFFIRPLNKSGSIIVKYAHEDAPSFQTFLEREFPFAMLPEDFFTSRRTLPERPDDDAEVFLVQATFLRGGLILAFVGQHNCMDMAGQVQIIRLMAKACGQEIFSSEDIKMGNVPRRNIIPLLDEVELEIDKSKMIPVNTGDKEPTEASWGYCIFSGPDLARIKAIAMETVPSGFISTDDVLSAFLWQAISRSRLKRLGKVYSTFHRQVDARPYLGIPQCYPGVAVYTVSVTLSLDELVAQPLGFVAFKLREQLSQKIAYEARNTATVADQKIKINGYASEVPRVRNTIACADIKMSSWAKEDCYQLDFGAPLGKPTCIRRPNFPGWEGLAYLMPKRTDGEIAAAICLREEDMSSLKSDPEFMKWSRYIG